MYNNRLKDKFHYFNQQISMSQKLTKLTKFQPSLNLHSSERQRPANKQIYNMTFSSDWDNWENKAEGGDRDEQLHMI